MFSFLSSVTASAIAFVAEKVIELAAPDLSITDGNNNQNRENSNRQSSRGTTHSSDASEVGQNEMERQINEEHRMKAERGREKAEEQRHENEKRRQKERSEQKVAEEKREHKAKEALKSIEEGWTEKSLRIEAEIHRLERCRHRNIIFTLIFCLTILIINIFIFLCFYFLR